MDIMFDVYFQVGITYSDDKQTEDKRIGSKTVNEFDFGHRLAGFVLPYMLPRLVNLDKEDCTLYGKENIFVESRIIYFGKDAARKKENYNKVAEHTKVEQLRSNAPWIHYCPPVNAAFMAF